MDLRHRVVTMVCALSVLLVQIDPALAASPPVQVTADNSTGNGAITGQVLGSTSSGATIGVTNLHDFWTNTLVQPISPASSAKLTPANPMAGGVDIGGLYAALGAIGPNQQAVWLWNVDPGTAASQTILTTPSLAGGGSPVAGALNVLTFATAMLDAVPSASSASAVLQAVQIAMRSPDFVGAVQSIQSEDAQGFAVHFYSLLSDDGQRAFLQQALAILGVQVSVQVLKDLTLVITIVQLAEMAGDEILAIVDGSSAGGVIFSTVPVTSSPVLAAATPTVRLPPSPSPTNIAPSTPTPVPTATSLPQSNGFIAYSGMDGNIWIIHPDGSGKLQVTTNGSVKEPFVDPNWSHDGTMLVFEKGASLGPSIPDDVEFQTGDVYLYRRGSIVRVGQFPGCASPSFSRDNRNLVFACAGKEGSLGAVASSNLDGSGWQVLIPYSQVPYSQAKGTYSFSLAGPARPSRIDVSASDGALLLTVSSLPGDRSIVLADAKGQHLQPVAESSEYELLGATFASNGSDMVAYQCSHGCPRTGNWSGAIQRITRSGSVASELVTLPTNSYVFGPPSMSPDGQSVTYAIQNRLSEPPTIVTAGASGSMPKVLSPGFDPAWQPTSVPISLSIAAKPGGTWISPANGASLTGSTLRFAAYAYPTNPGDPPIDHVNFTVWWPDLGPKSGPWKIACVAKAPSTGDVFQCDLDLQALKAPVRCGLTISFDVYDRAGNKNLSPNGEHMLPGPGDCYTGVSRPAASTLCPLSNLLPVAVDRTGPIYSGAVQIAVRKPKGADASVASGDLVLISCAQGDVGYKVELAEPVNRIETDLGRNY